ncbi:hypothetical protein I7X12_12355 [Halosimplex litoreum]|uniref:Uncharacterized protein n=1 Tax=Halosimplex litoreum TaxID=1198301 RepID=A0A7T3KU08_9EURY|nr:hypothetical protein [Halosimplex litoreum]QPV61554.1 hypothetical protein I7X12_12355 [Halosimplex litoreum]
MLRSAVAGFAPTLSWLALAVGGLALVLVEPAAAQTATAAPNGTGVGSSFCQTDMATTVRNLFTLIQFGGPLIGGLVALGTTVAIPVIRRADTKKELKSMRVQAVVWGVIVAPLGTTILQFLLTSVVAGGASCSF